MAEPDQINVLTPQAPPSPEAMRFLCDQMLAGLGKWLRAAGYDTAVAGQGIGDTRLLDWARREARILLTCDRRMQRERPPLRQPIVVLPTSQIDKAGAELTRRLAIDWQWRRFTRCMCDNTLLEPAGLVEARRVPQGCGDAGMAMICPVCRRLYWRGSHTSRMEQKLAAFARS